jgi:drug/metabolite transporter (DMT)-like permease
MSGLFLHKRLPHSTNLSDYVRLHSAVLLFGLAGLFGKFLSLSPLLIVAGRTFFASLTMGLILMTVKSTAPKTSLKAYLVLLLLGFLLALHWVTFFQAIQMATVAIGLLTYASYPVFVVLIESVTPKTRSTKSTLLALSMVILGLILIIPDFNLKQAASRGAIWGVVSGFSFAILTLANRRLVQQTSALIITGGENLGAFLLLLPFIWHKIPFVQFTEWELLLFLGIVCTALAHWLFNQGLRTVSAQNASIIATLEPVYGILAAFFIIQESLVFSTILGGIIILIGSLIVTLHKLPNHNQKPL